MHVLNKDSVAASSEEVPQKVKLRSDKNEGMVIRLIELIVFCRLQFFRNQCRGNYILIQSLWPILMLAVIVILGSQFLGPRFGISFDLSLLNYTKLGLFIGAWSANHWRERAIFYDKWKYLAGLYNEVLKQKEDVSDVLQCALAIDILTLGFWAHRSYQELFRDALVLAVRECREEPAEMIRRIFRGEMSEDEALKILEDHQKSIFKRASKKELEKSAS